jgi:hypothetical protein
MAISVITRKEKPRYNIACVIKKLEKLHGVTVVASNAYRKIEINHPLKGMANFRLAWSEAYGYFRVYIRVVRRKGGKKENAGYSFFLIRGTSGAEDFVRSYRSFHKSQTHRGHLKLVEAA